MMGGFCVRTAALPLAFDRLTCSGAFSELVEELE